MNQSLKTFKAEYQNHLLNFLWRQWSSLGVAGQSRGDDVWIIDPESLLLFTCTLGRHEPRLFDEVLDWFQENGRFINILRLKRILGKEKFAGARVLAAIAGLMSKGTDVTKWKQLAEVAGTGISHGDVLLHRRRQAVARCGRTGPAFRPVRLHAWPSAPARLLAEIPSDRTDQSCPATARAVRRQQPCRGRALPAHP